MQNAHQWQQTMEAPGRQQARRRLKFIPHNHGFIVVIKSAVNMVHRDNWVLRFMYMKINNI